MAVGLIQRQMQEVCARRQVVQRGRLAWDVSVTGFFGEVIDAHVPLPFRQCMAMMALAPHRIVEQPFSMKGIGSIPFGAALLI
ncbi:hypothetical protein [Noviherbaspirillum agri]